VVDFSGHGIEDSAGLALALGRIGAEVFGQVRDAAQDFGRTGVAGGFLQGGEDGPDVLGSEAGVEAGL
jgi:hypothetical protein